MTVETRLQRLADLVANLAHPNDDRRENALEEEAHDLILGMLENLKTLRAAVAVFDRADTHEHEQEWERTQAVLAAARALSE